MKVKVQTLDAKSGGDIELKDEIFASSLAPTFFTASSRGSLSIAALRLGRPASAVMLRARQEVGTAEGRRYCASRRSQGADLHRRRQGSWSTRADFMSSLNKKVRQLGLKMALSSKAREGS